MKLLKSRKKHCSDFHLQLQTQNVPENSKVERWKMQAINGVYFLYGLTLKTSEDKASILSRSP